MTHVRQQIREAIAARLTGLPLTGSRVYSGRPFPLNESEVPGWFLATPQEQTSIDAIGDDPALARTATVSINGYASGKDIEHVLDDMALAAEKALAADVTLGGLALDVALTAMDRSAEEAAKPTGILTLTYQVLYRTPRSAPDVATP